MNASPTSSSSYSKIEQRNYIQYLGARVAKEFIDSKTGKTRVYYGIVKRFDVGVVSLSAAIDKGAYLIVYDDDDMEHVSYSELQKMIQLYQYGNAITKSASSNMVKREKNKNGSRKRNSVKLEKNNKKQQKNDEKMLQSLWNLFPSIAMKKDNVLNMIGDVLQLNYKERAFQVGQFFLFCYERQQIWVRKKQNQPPPWTKNKILQTKHFCNVYRELDRGTVYFHRHVLQRRKQIFDGEGKDFDANQYLSQILWAALCYRMLARIETFQEFGDIPTFSQWNEFRKLLEDAHVQNKIIFTGAYNVCGFRRYCETISWLLNNNCMNLLQLANQLKNARTLKTCVQILCGIQNVGKFLSWQIICDLLESNAISVSDENEWVHLGPGAVKGVKLIFGVNELPQKVGLELCTLLCKEQNSIFEALGVNFQCFRGKPLGLKEFEHALCEYQKYIEIEEGKTGKNKCKRVQELSHSCQECNKEGNNDMEYEKCDSCGRSFCLSCSGTTHNVVSWVCNDCKNLDEVKVSSS